MSTQIDGEYVMIHRQSKPKPGNSWVAKRIHKHDRWCVECDRLDVGFARWVNHDFAMMEHLQDQRHNVTEELMTQFLEKQASDQQEDTDQTVRCSLPKRSKKEVMDNIAGALGLNIWG